MSYNLNSLIIVGYTEVPVLTPPRPRILSQIFRVDKKDIVLYPPYKIYKKYVGLAKKHPSKGLNYLIIARSAKPDGIEAKTLIKKYI